MPKRRVDRWHNSTPEIHHKVKELSDAIPKRVVSSQPTTQGDAEYKHHYHRPHEYEPVLPSRSVSAETSCFLNLSYPQFVIMAPSSTSVDPSATVFAAPKEPITKSTQQNATPPPSSLSVKPLNYTGSLDEYEYFDVTNVIGREYPKANLLEILKSNEKIRDLAITVSERGVVFFRNQDISIEEQKILGQKLGELTGKPETSKVWFNSLLLWLRKTLISSKLHRHALLNSKRGLTVDEFGEKLDDEVSIISSQVCCYATVVSRSCAQ